MTQYSFHHIGIACRDIRVEADNYALLGYSPEGAEFEDPKQGIQGRFYVGPGPRIELLCPLEGSKVLDPWLQRDIKMYHLAYEVPSLDQAVADFTAKGSRQVSEAVPAVAFAGRRIVFLMLPNMALFELIEE